MICLFGFTLNIAQAFETTWIQLTSFYVSTHFLLLSLGKRAIIRVLA